MSIKLFFYEVGGKLAGSSPDGKRSPLPMDIRNTRGLAYTLPTFKHSKQQPVFDWAVICLLGILYDP